MYPILESSMPFHSSRLKVSRANEHIEALNLLQIDYRSRSPITATAMLDPSDPAYVISTPVMPELIPEYWSTLIGDAVHNLRASLDILACELVRRNGQDDKGVYFPFAYSADELPGQIISKKFNRAGADAVKLLTELKPYMGGNPILRGVHDLDRADKHVMLLPTVGAVMFPDHGGGAHLNARQHKSATFGTWRTTREHAATQPYMEIGRRLTLDFTLVFPGDGPFADQPLIDALTQASSHINGVIDAFSAL